MPKQNLPKYVNIYFIYNKQWYKINISFVDISQFAGKTYFQFYNDYKNSRLISYIQVK